MSLLLWPQGTPNALGEEKEDRPTLVPFLVQSEQPTSAVVVCPGGGYGRRADHEGEPVARWLNTLGISAFVLHYRVAPYRHPNPLMDAQRAIRTVRHNAEAWNVDPKRVGILGFSAGGHLASSAGTQFDGGNAEAADPIERESSRPDLVVLCYPVITFGPYTHSGSRNNLLGDPADPALVELMSSENRVTEDTPPTFIWHTADDAGVPVENAMMFASALRKNKVPFELHIYESGRHGLGLAQEHPEARTWPNLCANWLKKQGF
ncbi:alpha/beta hydrolase [Paenibacillus allorhizosphaerae]|uniref:Acetylxylan esterase n=1 Tax=Paenibacillus allorhizosphaerae TaxID=2849866 RepID=A0ABN7TY60_9BACL|nr:alpha/beta hydrolase [Paenibacillus allorhizosphaerae]CAG7656482.1 Acetylxylan esterase [Paenibacillus allorhizosphaerae]